MTGTTAFPIAPAEEEAAVDDACKVPLAVDAAAVGRVVTPAPVADVLFKVGSVAVDEGNVATLVKALVRSSFATS